MREKLIQIIEQLHSLLDDFDDELGACEEYTRDAYLLSVAQAEYNVIADVTERLEELVE